MIPSTTSLSPTMDTVAKRIRSELPSPPQSNDGELGREASLDPSRGLQPALPPLYSHGSHFQPAIAAGESVVSDTSVRAKALITLSTANQ